MVYISTSSVMNSKLANGVVSNIYYLFCPCHHSHFVSDFQVFDKGFGDIVVTTISNSMGILHTYSLFSPTVLPQGLQMPLLSG